MSVCEGGGWNPHDKQGPLTKRCPGMYVRNKPFICYFGKEPDTCPHAAALKAVVENPELVLVAVQKNDAVWLKRVVPSDAELQRREE